MKKTLSIISVIFAFSLILTGCSNPSGTLTDYQTEAKTSATGNTRNTLLNTSESKIVELKNGDTYDLIAEYVNKEINGVTFKMLAYNGSIPGPILKVKQGAEVTINLKNNTDIPTSLHSHGIRLEDKYDGIVDVHQKQIDPGETFVYKIKFPDAGIFWYHPHLHEPYTQSHGLYGSYWVVPDESNYWSPANEEIPLILNDIAIHNGRTDSFNSKEINYALMGEFGNVMLVNGSTNYQRSLKSGEVIRFYLVNASNTRVYNLSFLDSKMKLVGGDNGKYEHETWQDNIVLSPSERAIVEVMFNKPGTYLLQNNNLHNSYDLAKFIVSEEQIVQSFAAEFEKLRDNEEVITDIDKFRDDFSKKADKSVTLTMKMTDQGHMSMMGNNSGQHTMSNGQMMENSMMMGDDQETIEWEDNMPMMNAMSTTETVKWKIVDDETKKENDQIDWKFKKKDGVKIRIYNDPNSMHPMQHPIHFHGQRFLVLSTDGVKNNNLVWKDTVLVPKGATVEILVDMSNPGKWMAHCHISEHLSSNMMLPFEVE